MNAHTPQDATAPPAAAAEPDDAPPRAWGAEHNAILVDWADKAMCYRWLHNREHQRYSHKNLWFTLPVIVISTITGTANFAQEHFPNHRAAVAVTIGSFNILAAIITTIAQFLKIAEVNESHRVATLSWDKFYRNVRLTLTRSPDERMPVVQQLKAVKEEFDRMMELSPPISPQVVAAFQATFRDQPSYADIIKPDICGELRSTRTFVYAAPAHTCPTHPDDPTAVFIRQFRELHNRSPLQEEIVLS